MSRTSHLANRPIRYGALVAVRLPADLLSSAEAKAERENRTLSDLLRSAVDREVREAA